MSKKKPKRARRDFGSSGDARVAEDDAAESRTYLLEFSLWRCDFCAAEFSALAGCQKCGKDGPQPDPHVETRERLVDEVRQARPVLIPGTPVDITEIWSDLANWMDAFHLALGEVAGEQPEGVIHLISARNELAQLRANLAATPRNRPFVALWRTLDRILNHLSELADAALPPLVASTPSEAEERQKAAQLALDNAAEEAGASARIAGALGLREGEAFFDALASHTQTVFADVEATGLTDFDAQGAAIFARLTGGAAYPQGLGLSLLLVEHVVRDLFDVDRYHAEGSRAFGSYIDRPEALDRLAKDSAWREALGRAKRELFSSGVDITEAARATVRHEWFELRALLRLGQQLAEGVAPFYLATLLALRQRKDWARLARADIGQLLKETTDAGFGGLALGIDVSIRDADAHRDYRLDGSDVVLPSGRGGAKVPIEKLIDTVLAGMESCLLLDAALTCALVARGVPVEELDAASDLIPMRERVRLLATASGLQDVKVSEAVSVLSVEGRTAIPDWSCLPVAAGIEVVIPADFQELRFVIAQSGRRWRAHGPLEPFREFRAASGIGREARSVEAMARWIIRGQPGMSRQVIRCWAARRLGQLLDGDLDSVLEAVEAFAALAVRLGDKRMSPTMEAAGRMKRAKVLGLEPLKGDSWATEQLLAWIDDCGEQGRGGLVPA